jgi:hypothetical protein
MTQTPDTPEPTLRDVMSALTRLELHVDRLDVRVESLNLEMQRGLFAIERRLATVEDALADWAASYWSHTDHPPSAA